MKKLVHALVCALTLGATMPVVAGPDWQLIEKARKDKQSSPVAQQDAAKPGAANCPPERLVLPLDHGPRALSTPYLNQIRKERHEAQVRACSGAPR